MINPDYPPKYFLLLGWPFASRFRTTSISAGLAFSLGCGGDFKEGVLDYILSPEVRRDWLPYENGQFVLNAGGMADAASSFNLLQCVCRILFPWVSFAFTAISDDGY